VVHPAAMLVGILLLAPCDVGAVLSSDTLVVAGDSSNVGTLEETFERSMGDPDDTDLAARLLWLQEHPIDLNDATEDDLLNIPGVMPADVAVIQLHRRTHRPFKNVLELGDVEGLSPRGWFQLRQFITVGSPRRPLVDLRSRIAMSVGSTSGVDAEWLGNPTAHMQRLITAPARGWECGCSFESDAGEQVQHGFVTGYIHHESAGVLRQLILGDMSIAGGLGLVWGEGMRNAGIMAGPVCGTLIPHRSTSEQDFLRGIGASLAFPCASGELRFHTICSHNACPATVVGSGSINGFSSVVSYRTENDLKKRNAAHVSCFGGRIEYLAPRGVRCGSSVMFARCDQSILADRPFDLSGNEFWSTGVDCGFQIGAARGAIEAAFSRKGSGVLGLLVFSFFRGCALHVSYRRCTPDFHSPMALGGSWGDAVRNMHEIICSVDLVPIKGSFLQVKLSQYRRPWRLSTELLPNGGQEVSAELGFSLATGLDLRLKGGEHLVEQEINTDSGGRLQVCKKFSRKGQLQCTATFTRGERWFIRSRVEYLRYSNPSTGSDEYGWMGSGEMRWTPGRWLTLSGRAMLFQTDTYDSRVYAIESDIDGGISSTLLAGTGRRWYCMAASRFCRSLKCAVRYASTVHMRGSREVGWESRLSLLVDFQLDPP
jgi:hypothetical protein